MIPGLVKRCGGHAIGREWWGTGFAPEAARTAIVWAVETFDLSRIWASRDARNVRSRRVLEKLGMQLEEFRVGDHMGRAGELIDEVAYGLSVAPGCKAD